MKIKKHILIVISGIVVLLLLLFLEFASLFRVTNWDKYYWQKKPWTEILSDPSSFKEASVIFLGLYGIAIIIGVIVIYRKRKHNKLPHRKQTGY